MIRRTSMKHVWVGFFCALFAFGTGAELARGETILKASLVTSEAASRMSVELTEDGATVASLSDGEGTIESGEVEIDDSGKISLELESETTGTAFILINQADTDNDGDRDFLFSEAFTLGAGEVTLEFPEAIPAGTGVEDVVVTIVLNSQDESGTLDENDTILAVPGFAVQEEDEDGEVEPEEFEVEGPQELQYSWIVYPIRSC